MTSPIWRPHQDSVKNLARHELMKYSKRSGSWTPDRSRGSLGVAVKIQYFFALPPYTVVQQSEQEGQPPSKGLA